MQVQSTPSVTTLLDSLLPADPNWRAAGHGKFHIKGGPRLVTYVAPPFFYPTLYPSTPPEPSESLRKPPLSAAILHHRPMRGWSPKPGVVGSSPASPVGSTRRNPAPGAGSRPISPPPARPLGSAGIRLAEGSTFPHLFRSSCSSRPEPQRRQHLLRVRKKRREGLRRREARLDGVGRRLIENKHLIPTVDDREALAALVPADRSGQERLRRHARLRR